MSKRNYMISINEQTMTDLQNIEGKGNVSQRIEDLITNYLGVSQNRVGVIDKQILLLRIAELKEKSSLASSELIRYEQQLKIIERQEEEDKMQELQKERDTIENIGKCLNCGGFLDEKHKYKVLPEKGTGSICRSCFFNMTPKELDKWF